MLYKTVCRFSCNEGFEAKGSMVRSCTENGTWSATDVVCEGIHTNGSTLKPTGRKRNAYIIRDFWKNKRPSNACKFKISVFVYL